VNYTRILVESGTVGRVTLARPEVRNAFDAQLISELTHALNVLASALEVRVLVLAAQGDVFCAGADFHWMSGLKRASLEENSDDARRLFDMFHALYSFPRPTVARVQGNAYGGGAGLLACCDFVILSDAAQLAFSEVRIGLVPATIAPFVIRRIGEGRARELFLSAAPVKAARALEVGLASRVVSFADLDAAVEECVSELLQGGPQALAATKRLLRDLYAVSLGEAKEITARVIAERRVSDEGQEGMAAFLEKRRPKWTKTP
jgi:methylglutaconyl-CoA hydratase